MRDAAYDSLLKTKRHELHAQIADMLEQRFSSIVVIEPETLAQHLTLAGIHERAAPYWVRAGERALSGVALAEAVGHLIKALSAISRIPASLERDRQELQIRLLLSTAYLSFLGWAAIEVAQTLEPARELAIRLNENDRLIPILYYIWFHHLMRCEYDQCRIIVRELDVLARSPGDSSTSLIAGMTEALTFFFTGEIRQVSQAADRVFKAYEPERHRQLVHTYNHDPKCLTLVWAGYWLWAMGYPDKARQAAQEQLEMARRLQHPFNLFVALSVGTVGLTVCGETTLARQWLVEAKAIAEEHAMKFMADVIVPFWDGPALIVHGDHEEGYARLTVGSKGWRDTGPLHLIPFANIMRARALTALERFDEATGLLNETLQIIGETGHRSEEAEVYCAIGELQRRQTNTDAGAAEASFNKALEIARFQGAKGWELRAATALASLWKSQGKGHDAYRLLAPIYNWFTEGFGTKDLIEAKALLAELA